MILRATDTDTLALAQLAIQMWASHSLAELERDFAKALRDENAACFLAYAEGKPIGFAQCGLRFDYVEGTETSPVGYLEGILIQEAYRHRGFARKLLEACENWARSKKCTEFASDCELGNRNSLSFHLAMGFEEANRVICFRKSLS